MTGGGFAATSLTDNAWVPGDVIGEVVVNSYIRFHARVTNSAISLAVKEQSLGHKMLEEAKKKAARETAGQ